MIPNTPIYSGYARVDITPDYAVHLSGYGDDEIRRSEGIRDNIYITCIAVTSGDETILMYTADLLSFNADAANELRTAVFDAVGVEGDHIFVGATHSHSGPVLYGELPKAPEFRQNVYEAAVEAAKAALDDRAVSKLLTTTKRIPGMNFIRHYLIADGTYSGSNFGDASPGRVGHAGMSDPRMVLLKFERINKPDIVIMNWQAHNDNVREVGYYYISSSYTGHIRAKFEKETGMHFAYFTGASGNQNRDSLIDAEKHGLNYIDYGIRMAEYAAAALPDLKPVEGTKIKTLRVNYEARVDHSWDHMLPQANEVFELWKSVGKKEGDALGKKYGFTSSYQSRDIRRRAAMGETIPLELNAFCIGEIGFITGTYEMFSDTGIYVRAYAPFDTVFICTGNATYVPSATSYDYRSYEADTTLYEKGTCEKLSREYVRMLESLV